MPTVFSVDSYDQFIMRSTLACRHDYLHVRCGGQPADRSGAEWDHDQRLGLREPADARVASQRAARDNNLQCRPADAGAGGVTWPKPASFGTN